MLLNGYAIVNHFSDVSEVRGALRGRDAEGVRERLSDGFARRSARAVVRRVRDLVNLADAAVVQPPRVAVALLVPGGKRQDFVSHGTEEHLSVNGVESVTEINVQQHLPPRCAVAVAPGGSTSRFVFVTPVPTRTSAR